MSFEINTSYALGLLGALCSIIGAIVSLFLFIIDNANNPYWKYFIVASIMILAFLWVALYYSSPREQILSVFIIFLGLIIILWITLEWRELDIKAWQQNPSLLTLPYGFEHKPSYFPFFLLLSSVFLGIICMMLYCTHGEKFQNNRIWLFLIFFVCLIALFFIRYSWRCLDQPVIEYMNNQKIIARTQTSNNILIRINAWLASRSINYDNEANKFTEEFEKKFPEFKEWEKMN